MGAHLDIEIDVGDDKGCHEAPPPDVLRPVCVGVAVDDILPEDDKHREPGRPRSVEARYEAEGERGEVADVKYWYSFH